MKKIQNKSKIALIISICIIGFFTACTTDPDLKLPYLFRPINFNVEMNKTVATITWSPVDSAQSYRIQISQDSTFRTVVLDSTTTVLSITKELAGETDYYARVKANAADTTKSSQFNKKLRFRTPAENIFAGYGTSNNTGKLYSAYMTDIKTLTVKWLPGANVTHLILVSTDGLTRDSVTISPSEAIAGVKIVDNLANSNWYIKIYNNKAMRGKIFGLVEGDIIVNSGDNLLTALTTANAGQVILLAGNSTFSMGSAAFAFSKNIKIRSASPTNRSIICMTAGTPTNTTNMLGITAGSVIDSLVFENLDITGYCDNNPSSTKIGYLFNNKLGCTVTDIKFLNCKIRNVGNTPFRLSGGTPAAPTRFTNLIFNGCLMNDLGFGSGYGIVNISKSSDYIDNITFSNSTIYNFSYPVIAIAQTAVTTMNSVKITNCTFNQTTQNTAATRVIFSFDFINITNGVSISKCIFGSSTLTTTGLKMTNISPAPPTLISGSYFTSDYTDEALVAGLAYSIKGNMTSYSGASTSLWNAPTTGDFTLKDTGFVGKGVAGDLRWY